MYSVLIADDNGRWAQSLARAVGETPELEVAAAVLNGRDAIEKIEEMRPDIIILDVVMPEYDGVNIVSHIRSQMRGYAPVIYMLSGIGAGTVFRILNDLGIDYYSMKPVDISVILRNIRMILQKKQGELTERPPAAAPDAYEERARGVMRELGAPPGFLSTRCAIEVVALCLRYENSPRILTKILYPEAAKKCGVTPASVEKNIRGVVAQLQKKKTVLFEQVFAYHGEGKISNGEFILTVADYIRGSFISR
ncbi:MAG: response regulator [Oscillospiraceae bacterium]|jgi:two-component system response regulator (stage 0 sporulation protein A)|nr:response regulator [Oscillospiraceae bacterium]